MNGEGGTSIENVLPRHPKRLREHGAQIQQDPAFFYASDDWRLRSAEARGYFIRAQTVARHGKQLGR